MVGNKILAGNLPHTCTLSPLLDRSTAEALHLGFPRDALINETKLNSVVRIIISGRGMEEKQTRYKILCDLCFQHSLFYIQMCEELDQNMINLK